MRASLVASDRARRGGSLSPAAAAAGWAWAATPTPEELESAGPGRSSAGRAENVTGHLALLGDKSLLFSESGRSGFLMYAVSGRSWVCMGDPVGGSRRAGRELVWQFRGVV